MQTGKLEASEKRKEKLILILRLMQSMRTDSGKWNIISVEW